MKAYIKKLAPEYLALPLFLNVYSRRVGRVLGRLIFGLFF